MNKYILGIAVAALMCSPCVFADTSTDGTTGQSQPMTTDTSTTPTAPDTSTTPTTPDASSTPTTPTGTDTSSSSTDVQVKTADGKVIHIQVDPKDLQGVKVGDKLEVSDLGTSDAGSATTTNPVDSNAAQ